MLMPVPPTLDVHDSSAGQRAYSRLTLPLYDLWVLGLSNRLAWRCPTAHIQAHYDRNVSARHLDIGVGTGYYLAHAKWPVPHPHITLLDLNPQSLGAASRRIAWANPAAVEGDALARFPDAVRARGPFGSVALTYLLHCMPGAIADKAQCLDHVGEVLAPGGRIFGATIVQDGPPPNAFAKTLTRIYNNAGIFSNSADRLDGLEGALISRFKGVRVRRTGHVALFEASMG
jgi:SAM-dependent methyltransferase